MQKQGSGDGSTLKCQKKKQQKSAIGFSLFIRKEKAGGEGHSDMTTLGHPITLCVFRARWGTQSYRLQTGRLSVLPAAWQDTAQEQDEQLKCCLSMFWCIQLPSLTFSKAAKYCHNWPCKILLHLSKGGGGTYFPKAPAMITLLMYKHLSGSAHPIA